MYRSLEKINRKIANLNEADKATKKHILLKELNSVRENIKSLDLKMIKNKTILFGGQAFELSDFIYEKEENKGMGYTMPCILTVEEYFKDVEDKIKRNEPSKFKM